MIPLMLCFVNSRSGGVTSVVCFVEHRGATYPLPNTGSLVVAGPLVLNALVAHS